MKNGKYYQEHRYVVEQKIGRPLLNAEVVHHINFDKLDNRPENLMIVTRTEHMQLDCVLAKRYMAEHPELTEAGLRALLTEQT